MNPNGNPNWKKGVSGNPHGRPSHGLDELKKAIYSVEQQRGMSFFQLAVEKAFEGDTMMIQGILRKLVPDLKHLEGELKLEHLNLMREVVRELSAKRQAKEEEKPTALLQ